MARVWSLKPVWKTRHVEGTCSLHPGSGGWRQAASEYSLASQWRALRSSNQESSSAHDVPAQLITSVFRHSLHIRGFVPDWCVWVRLPSGRRAWGLHWIPFPTPSQPSSLWRYEPAAMCSCCWTFPSRWAVLGNHKQNTSSLFQVASCHGLGHSDEKSN